MNPRNQVHPLVTQKPAPADPGIAVDAAQRITLQWQGVSHHLVQSLIKHLAQPGAFQLVIQPRVVRIDVDRQLPLAPQVIPGVFIAGHQKFVADADFGAQQTDEAQSITFGVVLRLLLIGKQIGFSQHGSPSARQ